MCGTRRQWGMQHGGSGFGAADKQVEKAGLDTLQSRDYNGTAHCSTRRWWPRVCRGRVGVSPPQLQCSGKLAMFTRESRSELLHGHWNQLLIRRAGGGHSWYPTWDIRLCLGLNEHKTMVKFTQWIGGISVILGGCGHVDGWLCWSRHRTEIVASGQCCAGCGNVV